jgi:hypothetical protein
MAVELVQIGNVREFHNPEWLLPDYFASINSKLALNKFASFKG